jgi:hypothetical protein
MGEPLAVTLHEAGAAAGENPVTEAMLGPAFSELVTKGIARRNGVTERRHGKPGSVRLAVGRE